MDFRSHRRLPFAPLFLLILVIFAVDQGLAQTPYDLVIRNGRVLDGSGNPWFRADVAIRGDRIAALGTLGNVEALREIDASGLYLAPGFIDSHSHAAGRLSSEDQSRARPLLRRIFELQLWQTRMPVSAARSRSASVIQSP